MASDTDSYLRQLQQRGYKVPDRKNGRGHIEVWFGETLVATHTGTRAGGRAFANFKAQVSRFEKGRPTVRVRKKRSR